MEHLYLEPYAVAIWTAVILVSFVLILTRVCASLGHMLAYRRELVLRAQGLRIHRMLSRAGTTLSRYLRRARPIDVEVPLLAMCEQYYDAQPNSFTPRRQHSALNYLPPAGYRIRATS